MLDKSNCNENKVDDAISTIRKLFARGEITVPTYQRAYSWETPRPSSERKTHTDVFLSDLERQLNSNSQTPYYFGHFLFQKKDQEKDFSFYVIDGQQRLTTIVIFLSALFAKLRALRQLTDDEEKCFGDIVKQRSDVRFSTVNYDDLLFKDYVINRSKKDKNSLDTESAKRIVSAFDFFEENLANKDQQYLTCMLDIITEASCSNHDVLNESEAIQMFIFQNNRGKKPSNLEIIKAQFMYHINLHGGDARKSLLTEIQERFEGIYKSISSIDHKINEDDVLGCTLRVYFNSLEEPNTLEKINRELLDDANGIIFIQKFSHTLMDSFNNLKTFFNTHEKDHYAIHSLVTLGGVITYPFIVKAYKFNLDVDVIQKLCASLESLIIRDRLVGTRANVAARVNEVFKKFTESNNSIEPIIGQVNNLKTNTNWWWDYWNNEELKKSLQGGLSHSIAKYLLWKYENHLKSEGERGYGLFVRYDKIIDNPELEHIAPSTEPKERPHGYDEYDDDFINNYLNCLGNYLLISKEHNASMQNDPFDKKRERYTKLEQHHEVQHDSIDIIWDKARIKARKDKIIKYIMEAF